MKKIITFAMMLFMLNGCIDDEAFKNITLDINDLSLEVDETHSFEASIIPSSFDNVALMWKSSDTKIVSVNNQGEIKAESVGEAIITVYNQCNSIKSSCTVTVNPTKATSLTLDEKTLNLIIDDQYMLKYQLLPEKTTNKNVIWESSDSGIATVDSLGMVKAVAVGKTTISIFNHDKSLTAKCLVDVSPIKATSIILNNKDMEIFINESATLTYKILPENTTSKSVTWSSANTNIVSVNSKGEILGVNVGETTVEVRIDELIFDTAKIKVKPNKATGISMSETEKTLNMNDKHSLVVNFTPQNTTNKKVTWESSNSDIATVSTAGIVSALKEGTTLITAVSDDGGFRTTCKITVNPVIIITPNRMELLTTQSKKLEVTDINNAPYYNAKWKSSNTDVAIVTPDANGQTATVKPLKKGTAIISATSVNGQVTVVSIIEVKEITDYIKLVFFGDNFNTQNGLTSGFFGSIIKNESPETIQLVMLRIFDGNKGDLVSIIVNPDVLGVLPKGETKRIGVQLDKVYKPIYRWTIKWNDNIYEIYHQYDSGGN